MIPAQLRNFWQQQEDLDHDADDMHSALSAHDHDMIVRYALLGILAIMTVAALQVAKAFVMPVVAGMIVGFTLGPLVDRMARFGLPQQLSAGLLVAVGVLVMLLVVGLFAAPFAIWSDQLPGILSALRDRLSDISHLVRRVEGLAGDLNPAPAPRVAVAQGSPWISIALTSTAAAGGSLIFVATIYFYLATRRRIKARMLRLCLGGSARRSAGSFFDGIELKIASYFGVVTLINLGMGLIAFGIAWSSELPFPVFWGLAAAVLNYIAFIGPVIMTALLFGAGLLDDGASWRAALPALAYFLVHLIEGNIVTPMLVGRRLTLSPFLVFLSFVFWLWLWGPAGAILSTPILLVMTLSVEAFREFRRLESEQASKSEADAGVTGAGDDVGATAATVIM